MTIQTEILKEVVAALDNRNTVLAKDLLVSLKSGSYKKVLASNETEFDSFQDYLNPPDGGNPIVGKRFDNETGKMQWAVLKRDTYYDTDDKSDPNYGKTEAAKFFRDNKPSVQEIKDALANQGKFLHS
jgi:hypothetical protein